MNIFYFQSLVHFFLDVKLKFTDSLGCLHQRNQLLTKLKWVGEGEGRTVWRRAPTKESGDATAELLKR